MGMASRFLTTVFIFLNGVLTLFAEDKALNGPKTILDIPYCTNGGVALGLDLYFPKTNSAPLPVVVYIHGGGWQHGSKTSGGWLEPVKDELLSRGYIVASVDYRLAPDHQWPAYINDVKCAIRFLRAQARQYNLDPKRIGTWGTSAGGHLVALLGTSDAGAKLEGEHYLDQSSRVQAVVDMFGPSDIEVMAEEVQHRNRGDMIFGGKKENFRQASPANYVSKDDPPFLIIHGENDALVLPKQATIFHEKLKAAGVESKLVMVKNGTHGLAGRNISPGRAELVKMIADFFDQHLKKPAAK
jgi:acetyl esterase/lipase